MELFEKTEEWTKLFLRLHSRFEDWQENQGTSLSKSLPGGSSHSPSSFLDDRVFPLDANMKLILEAFMETDLSRVKIHTGREAEQITRSHGAAAVTLGQDIYFSSEGFNPHTEDGQTLIHHELQHIKQHNESRPMRFHEDVTELEHEADIRERSGRDREDPIPLEDNGLGEFAHKNRTVQYRLSFPNGPQLLLPADEYEDFKSSVIEKLEERISDDLRFTTEEEKNEIITGVINWMEG